MSGSIKFDGSFQSDLSLLELCPGDEDAFEGVMTGRGCEVGAKMRYARRVEPLVEGLRVVPQSCSDPESGSKLYIPARTND